MNNDIEARTPKQGNTNIVCIVFVILTALIITAALILINNGSTGIRASYSDNFDKSYEDSYNRTYEEYKEMGRQAGYEKYHVKNQVSIRIGDISEKNDLEVLQVSDFDYAVSNKSDNTEKIDSVFEVCVSGIYTVNMDISEFIIDNKNAYVLVRVPEPVLSEYLPSERKMLYFQKNGTIFNIFSDGNYREGEAFALEQINKCENEIKEKLSHNQENESNAKESAKNTIRSIVIGLNPEIDDLKVDVEFDNSIIS